MNLALIGYGNVGRALGRLLHAQRSVCPFRITGIHTQRHGTAISASGLAVESPFGPAAESVDQFLDAANAQAMVELTTLNPSTGEPALSHIRTALSRGMHVVTANKGPIAHAYHELRDLATAHRALFRFESTIMDGAPVFNMVRRNLPAVKVLGFTGVLNSTSKVVVETVERGGTFEEGVAEAQRIGIAEADASFDINGWDSAAKTAALANVLMDARTSPLAVNTKGIARLTAERVRELYSKGKTVRIVSRARRAEKGAVNLCVRAEVLERTDILAAVHGTSNLLLLHTDLMGSIGTVSISPTVEQTAYGVFGDLVEVVHSRER